jgi:hypothetical protein
MTLEALIPLAHGGAVGLIVELSAAIGIAALGLAAWLGTRKERS